MSGGRYQVIHSEFVQWCTSYSGEKFHGVLCDPPYGLEFMGKQWDAPHKRTFTSRTRQQTTVPQAGPEKYVAGQAFSQWVKEWASALLPLLYPGALVFCFGGTRTWHRLAGGLEDAGFQMWDTLMWLHGQGFPKAQDISRLIDKANGNERKVIARKRVKSGGTEYVNRNNAAQDFRPGEYQKGENILDVTAAGSAASMPWIGHKTCALKPAWEPVLCFRAPSQGKSYAELAQMFGSGALYVDGARIPTADKLGGGDCNRACFDKSEGWSRPWMSDAEAVAAYTERTRNSVSKAEDLGRYPANVAIECICEKTEVIEVPKNGDVSGREPSSPTQDIYGKFVGRGTFKAYPGKAVRHTNPECPAAILDEQTGDLGISAGGKAGHTGAYSGGYKQEHYGDLKPGLGDSGGASRFFYTAKADNSERHGFNEVNPSTRNHHPTVKPIDLCRWLATLLLPPESVKPRRLLIPFSGSGSEIIGALQAGWDEITGVDQDAEYCRLVQPRIEHHVGLFAGNSASESQEA